MQERRIQSQKQGYCKTHDEKARRRTMPAQDRPHTREQEREQAEIGNIFPQFHSGIASIQRSSERPRREEGQ